MPGLMSPSTLATLMPTLTSAEIGVAVGGIGVGAGGGVGVSNGCAIGSVSTPCLTVVRTPRAGVMAVLSVHLVFALVEF